MEKHTLIHLFKKSRAAKISDYYIELYKDLQKKINIDIIIVYEDIKSIELNNKEKKEIEKNSIRYFGYNNKKEIKDFLDSIKNSNIQIYTYYEELIDLSNELKKHLGQKISEINGLFISKKLQRKNLLKYDKNISVNYLKYDNLENIDKKEILNSFNFPFIIKPSFAMSSSGVFKVNNTNDLDKAISKLKDVFIDINKIRSLKNYEVVIEEFIDGQMYTIDYFVDQSSNVFKTSLVKTNTLKEEFNIDDFGIASEIVGEDIDKEINKDKLYIFIEKNIKACKIRNTFVHHEFKLTPKGELKTIELNGRIGGYRPEMYRKSLGVNILEFLFNKDLSFTYKKYYQFIGLFPQKENDKDFIGIEKCFLEDLIKLNSYYSYMIKSSYIGKKIGFTKNGYKYFGSIRLVNENYNNMLNDYNFIKNKIDKSIIYKD